MPPLKHAKLSPSASERWISCPASIRMEASVRGEEEKESFYAREGTAAHALAEIKAWPRLLVPDTHEGNIDLTATAPRLHIAAGVEKPLP